MPCACLCLDDGRAVGIYAVVAEPALRVQRVRHHPLELIDRDLTVGVDDDDLLLFFQKQNLRPLLSRPLYTGTSGPGHAGRASGRRWASPGCWSTGRLKPPASLRRFPSVRHSTRRSSASCRSRPRRRSFAEVEGADEQRGRVGDEFNAARLERVPVSWCS